VQDADIDSPNHKGALAEAAIAYEALCLEIGVFRPLSEHSRAGLMSEIAGSLYLLPFDERIGSQSGIRLRLSPPQNGQRAAVHYASDYEFPGAVAQLGERRHGMPEARGSSPLSSIESPAQDTRTVGAHEFRNHFGYYMERAEQGEEILVTRRGKPTVRLVTAAAPRLPIAA
jgi:prevent-host-death family protein